MRRKVANATVEWASGATFGTEKYVDLPASEDDELLLAFVRNPSSETLLTGFLRDRFIDPNGGGVRYADRGDPGDVATFSVPKHNNPPTTPEAKSVPLDVGVAPDGSRLVLRNDTTLSGSGAFTASVQVWAI